MSSESYQWFALAALLIIGWLTEKPLPGMQRRLGVDPAAFDVEKVKAALMANWQEAGGIAAGVMGYVSRSGLAMLGWLPNIVLVPVITFYLLRDWDRFMAAIRDMLPRAATRVLDHRLAGDKVMRTKVL